MSTFRCRMPYCTGETWQARGVCDECYFARTDQLRALPEMYAATYVHIAPGVARTVAEEIRLPAVHGTVPINMAVYDALNYVGQVVDAWAAVARTIKRRTTVKAWGGAAFVANVRTLIHDDRRITSSYLVGDYVHDVFCAYHRLVSIASGYESKRLTVPCPVCDSVSVLARHSGEYAACLTCGTRFSHARLVTLEQNLKVAS